MSLYPLRKVDTPNLLEAPRMECLALRRYLGHPLLGHKSNRKEYICAFS